MTGHGVGLFPSVTVTERLDKNNNTVKAEGEGERCSCTLTAPRRSLMARSLSSEKRPSVLIMLHENVHGLSASLLVTVVSQLLT